MSRRKGRVLAFQGLFSWDIGKVPLEDVISFSWVDTKDEEAQMFAGLVIQGAVDHMDEIDKKIASHLTSSWTLERINKVSLAILRMGVYELTYQNGTDKRIIIDEAVEIAKKYGEDGSFRFINAVLDNISKE